MITGGGGGGGVTQAGPINYVGQGANAAFQNGWANAGAPDQLCGYYLDALNIVHLTGFLSSSGASVGVVFTLPVGFRPANNLFYERGAWSGGNTALVDLEITVNGNITVSFPGGVGTWFSLEGITFLAGA